MPDYPADIIEKFTPIALEIAGKFSTCGYDYVCIDAAVDAIYEAVSTHDQNGGRTLPAWVYYLCRKRVLDACKTEKRRRKMLPSVVEEKRRHRKEADPYHLAMVRDESEYLLSCLHSNHRRIIDLWRCGYTQAEIAERTGMRQSHVSESISKSLARIAEFHSRRKGVPA